MYIQGLPGSRGEQGLQGLKGERGKSIIQNLYSTKYFM